MSKRIRPTIRPVIALALALPALVATGQATEFLPVLGWQDDVDLVVAPDGEFVVIPEQSPDGSQARITIMDLAAATGNPLGITWVDAVPGFELGVDIIIIPEIEPGSGHTVLVPVESPDGSDAGVLVLLVNDAGGLLLRTPIMLGDLGFREDVDGTYCHYGLPVIAFFGLETPDGSERGVLAIDADPRDISDPPGVGACTLLSTDGRPLGNENHMVDWLPRLANAVDPVSYEIGDASRLALPVTGESSADLLLIDFDPNDPVCPEYMFRHFSVREVNETSTRPTSFPGFEWDVDMRLFELECGFGDTYLLVPVEGPDDDADVYLLDENGQSQWVLSIDGQSGGLDVPGFEGGVDLVPMCGLAVAPPDRVAIAVENGAGTDADLWIVNLASGELIASVEDPAINPDLTIEGWEIGVDPMRWTPVDLLAPVEDTDGYGRLITFDPDGHVEDLRDLSTSTGDWGFKRSVDPIAVTNAVAPYRPLFVPIERVGEGPSGLPDAEVLMCPLEPLLDGVGLSTLGTGVDFGAFAWDVDLGVIRAQEGNWLMLPEQSSAGARLRFEFVPGPTGFMLAVATEAHDTIPAKLQFFSTITGTPAASFGDVLGLVTGLDMAGKRGAQTPSNPPLSGVPGGLDADSDPTHGNVSYPVDVDGWDGGQQPDPLDGSLGALRHANPITLPLTVRFWLDEGTRIEADVLDVSGRRVRRLAEGYREAGEIALSWDGNDHRGKRISSGVYFLVVRTPEEVELTKIVFFIR